MIEIRTGGESGGSDVEVEVESMSAVEKVSLRLWSGVCIIWTLSWSSCSPRDFVARTLSATVISPRPNIFRRASTISIIIGAYKTHEVANFGLTTDEMLLRNYSTPPA